MSNQFQPLRFAAGERVQWLSKAQITEANFFEHRKRLRQSRFFANFGKELDRFAHSQFEQIVDRFPVQFHIQDVRLKTAAFALGAAYVKVAQELHFDLFETGSGTTFAASFAGTGHARDTGEDAKWKVDIDIFQIVLRGAHDLDERCRFPARFRYRN